KVDLDESVHFVPFRLNTHDWFPTDPRRPIIGKTFTKRWFKGSHVNCAILTAIFDTVEMLSDFRNNHFVVFLRKALSGVGLYYSFDLCSHLAYLLERWCPQSSSASRFTAGAFGFLTLTQSGERSRR